MFSEYKDAINNVSVLSDSLLQILCSAIFQNNS